MGRKIIGLIMSQYRRVIPFLLALSAILNIFTGGSIVKAETLSSNAIRRSYINFAKGKAIKDINVDDLSVDSLRIISLFLSNFYIPYSTSLDGGSAGEDQKDMKSAMKNSLKNICGFNDSTAEALIQLVYKYSLGTAKPVYWKGTTRDAAIAADMYQWTSSFTECLLAQYSRHVGNGGIESFRDFSIERANDWALDDSFDAVTSMDDSDTQYTFRATIGSFLGCCGARRSVNEEYWRGTDGSLLTTIDESGINYQDRVYPKVGFYTANSDAEALSGSDIGNVVLDNSDACMTAYGMYMDNVAFGDGIGMTLFARTQKEMQSVPLAEVRNCLLANCALYVDWVGNIFYDDGVERVILLPACANPYALSTLSGNFGDEVPLENFMGLYRVSKGWVTDSGSSTAKFYMYDNKKLSTLYSSERDTKIPIYRKAEGESLVYKFDRSIWFGRGLDDDEAAIFDQAGISDKDNNMYCNNVFTGVLCASSKDKKGDYNVISKGNGYKKGFENTESMSIPVSGNVVFYDSLNMYDGDKDNFSELFSNKSIFSDSYKINSTYKSATKRGNYQVAESGDSGTLMAIYLSYVFAYTNALEGYASFDESQMVLDLKFNINDFPDALTDTIDWSSIEIDAGDIDREIKSMMYYFLHPSEGIAYVANWLKNKVGGFFISWHEDIVGETDSNASTGMTAYIGFSGYTTVPSLGDLDWTSYLLSNYNTIIVYLILMVTVVMCCYIILGSITIQKAIASVFIFGVLAFLPPLAINATADIVNNTGDRIYGSKFTYWALVQHQTYLQQLYTAVSTNNYDDYTDFVVKMQNTGSGGGSSNVFTTTKLKWMSPKKDNTQATFTKAAKDAMGSSVSDDVKTQLLTPIMKTVNDVTTGETYLDSNDALYLYRDYMNITLHALKSYNLYTTYTGGGVKPSGKADDNEVKLSVGTYKPSILLNWGIDARDVNDIELSSGCVFAELVRGNSDNGVSKQGYKDVSSLQAVRNGFLFNTLDDNNSSISYYEGIKNAYTMTYVLNFPEVYVDSNKLGKSINELVADSKRNGYDDSIFRSYGLPQKNFNFCLTDLSTDDGSKYSKQNFSYFYYGLMSESPFYYFNYNLTDQLRACTSYSFSMEKSAGTLGSSGYMKSMLLTPNMGYFYNIEEYAGDGYGEMRDYMNMHDLFYYVIPLLRKNNSHLREFAGKYGINQFDDMRVQFTENGHPMINIDGSWKCLTGIKIGNSEDELNPSDDDISSYGKISWKDACKKLSSEEQYKYWVNYNIAVMFNMYTPWVDTIYDTSYADAEKITVAGEEFTVADPLDPTSYFTLDSSGNIDEGRPMVFSRSEMKYYGLVDSDLTEVEKKIIKVEEGVYRSSIDLLNYYNFDDDVLLSAMGMFEVFEFNKWFSETTILGEDKILYPQSYELKAFTYDAYLRLMLAETTGEDLQTEENESIYTRISKKTSLFFGILLLGVDVLAVYIIPVLRLFFLVVLFFLSIAMLVSATLKVELNVVSAVWSSILKPLSLFALLSIALQWVVSLFMFSGNKGVTGGGMAISLGDPTMLLIVMFVINGAAVLLYYRICKATFKDFVKFMKIVFENIVGAVAGAAKSLANGVLAGKRSARGMYDRSMARIHRRQDRQYQKSMMRNTSGGSDGGSGADGMMAGIMAGLAVGGAMSSGAGGASGGVNGVGGGSAGGSSGGSSGGYSGGSNVVPFPNSQGGSASPNAQHNTQGNAPKSKSADEYNNKIKPVEDRVTNKGGTAQKGDTGSKGSKGNNGLNGSKGNSGLGGSNGSNGINGARGSRGNNEVNVSGSYRGTNGIKSKNGSVKGNNSNQRGTSDRGNGGSGNSSVLRSRSNVVQFSNGKVNMARSNVGNEVRDKKSSVKNKSNNSMKRQYNYKPKGNQNINKPKGSGNSKK